MYNVNYIIWHTPRSGSNMLCNLLHQTKVAGIADYINCGFFVGYPFNWNKTKMNFVKDYQIYFNKQRTPNQVSGCKGGMSYFDEFRPLVGDFEVDRLLNTFTHHIWLKRRNKLEQAISRIVAASTKIWSTVQVDEGAKEFSEPVYSRNKVDANLLKIHQENTAIHDYLYENDKHAHIVYYEDIVSEPEYHIFAIMEYLGITDDYTFKQPTIRKQVDNRKDEFIERYLRGE